MAGSTGHTQVPRKQCVLLLKAPKEEQEDHFVEALTHAGYRPLVVPVLAFKFVNQRELASALRQADNLSGVILTSPRSVQAVSRASSLLKESGDTFDPSSLRCFVVGEATAAAARAAGFHPEGQETGNAEALAEVILETDYQVQEIIAYETGPSERLQDDVADVIKKEGVPESVVFFSPSGVQFTESIVQQGILPLQKMKVYALGPTTQKAVLAHDYHLDGVAAKPDPASLVQVLTQVIEIARFTV
ncbi:hypothetical protein BaRGS_00015541 [Batillaria attramentaria]|uniref:Tetrapyrrole biosynthesis uroporphyrinogen III synthase domain-containing protein n=1 Tax=Batillaria attramentaria TaxID=370345 RepID=A0ABD0L1B3_9CAEN